LEIVPSGEKNPLSLQEAATILAPGAPRVGLTAAETALATNIYQAFFYRGLASIPETHVVLLQLPQFGRIRPGYATSRTG